ncbi:transposase [Streptomyces sp. NPDC096339]|uniref:transposase n=1 Tax=Streptomyces sp. NPDC096339 TaxID=3366086 RepID=UPI003817EA4B
MNGELTPRPARTVAAGNLGLRPDRTVRRPTAPVQVARTAVLPTAPSAGRFAWLSPMMLWPLARRLVPQGTVRPQGGGTQRSDEEALFAAIVYVLVSDVPWRALPKSFPVSWQNTHRRAAQWTEAGLWDLMREAARGPQVPQQVKEWAGEIARMAQSRLSHSAAAPEPVPAAAAPLRVARTRSRVLEPGLRVRTQADFNAARIFGSGHAGGQHAGRVVRGA